MRTFRLATPRPSGTKRSRSPFRPPKAAFALGTRLPAIAGKELLRALQRAGFVVVRIGGSHHFVRHPDGRAAVVPVHGARDIPTGTLARILRDVRMSGDELRALL